MNKYLIIRFSSLGDIIQALPAAQKIRDEDPSAEIHWLTRSDFHSVAKSLVAVDRVWSLDRQGGFRGLRKMVRELHGESFTHLYDAHNNLRSFFVRQTLRLTNPRLKIVTRSKNRIRRILLFKFRMNFFERPFYGTKSFLDPLAKWLHNVSLPVVRFNVDKVPLDLPLQFPLTEAVIIAPGGAWELKKWPTEHWQELVKTNPATIFILIGGAEDKHAPDIAATAPERVLNLAGKLSWLQTIKLISLADTLISGDTGALHIADALGKNCIALIGPTAFGFPQRVTSKVLETPLGCRPCTKDGRGRCHNKVRKQCMIDITPQYVSNVLRQLPHESHI